MTMLFRMAWRNLFRNTRRTFITGSAIGLGLAAVLVTLAVGEGFRDYMVESATDVTLGHAQLHRVGYRKSLSAKLVIPDSERWLKKLEDRPEIEAVSPRSRSYGLLARSTWSALVQIQGVRAEAEKQVTRLHEKILEGRYLSGKPRELVIGTRLAKKLRASVGDKVVLTIAEAFSGEQTQTLLRVAGIFHTGDRALDSGLALVNAPDADRALGLGGMFHEIAVRFKRASTATNQELSLWPQFSDDRVELLSWTQLAPMISKSLELYGVMMLLIGLFTFGIIGMGILNTLLMGIFERTWEFGVLRSLGTSPRRIGGLIILETACLAMVALLIGSIIGGLLCYYFAVWGIDYAGISVGSVVMENRRMYAVWSWPSMLKALVVVYVMTLLFSVYPARRAARIIPAEALRAPT